MNDVFRALVYLLVLPIATCYHGGRAIVAAFRGVQHTPGGVYDDASRGWGRWLLSATRIPVQVIGRERIPAGPVVFIANHVSFVDIWALLQELPGSIRFVFKKEMEKIPIFGRALTSARHISIDRRRQGAAFATYDTAAEALRSGISAAVFAEGTRSRDGVLLPFKKGPFVLAISAGVPVVPVYVGGTFAIMRRGALVPRGGTVTLRLGQPIPTTGLTHEDRDALALQCRAAILSLAADSGDRTIAGAGAS